MNRFTMSVAAVVVLGLTIGFAPATASAGNGKSGSCSHPSSSCHPSSCKSYCGNYCNNYCGNYCYDYCYNQYPTCYSSCYPICTETFPVVVPTYPVCEQPVCYPQTYCRTSTYCPSNYCPSSYFPSTCHSMKTFKK